MPAFWIAGKSACWFSSMCASAATSSALRRIAPLPFGSTSSSGNDMGRRLLAIENVLGNLLISLRAVQLRVELHERLPLVGRLHEPDRLLDDLVEELDALPLAELAQIVVDFLAVQCPGVVLR